MYRLKIVEDRIIDTIQERMREDDTNREMSLKQELRHCLRCSSLAQLMALKRGLNTEIAGIIGITHDYGRIISGEKENHAERGRKPLKSLLEKTEEFINEEIQLIVSAVEKHSRKDAIDDKYDELIKDVDVLENYLSGKVRDKKEYQQRIHAVLKELELK